MELTFETFPENTAAGKAFKHDLDAYLQNARYPDVFWHPVHERWETYDRNTYSFARLSLPHVEVGTDYWTKYNILHEVINIGQATRALDAAAIWDPRDGYWYHFAAAQQAPRAPAPLPTWLKNLIADLAAVDANTSLTPDERHQARSALIQAAYGTPH